MMSETWADYVKRVTRHMTQRRAADLAGVNEAGVGRWMRGEIEAPRAESVVAFARALGHSPVEALVAAGYLMPEETDGSAFVARPLSEYADRELLEELARRAALREGS